MLDQMKLLSNCMVIGDRQKYLTMLVTLRAEVRAQVWFCSQRYVLIKGHSGSNLSRKDNPKVPFCIISTPCKTEVYNGLGPKRVHYLEVPL